MVQEVVQEVSGHCTAGSWRSFTALRKDAGLCCGSRLRKGEVFAYVGSIQNLKDLKGLVTMDASLKRRSMSPCANGRPGTCSGMGTDYLPTTLPTVASYALPVPEPYHGRLVEEQVNVSMRLRSIREMRERERERERERGRERARERERERAREKRKRKTGDLSRARIKAPRLLDRSSLGLRAFQDLHRG